MSARILAVAVLSLAYVLASHWLMTSAPPSPWNAVGLLSPMLAAAAFGTWQAGQRWRALGALGLIAALCLMAALGVEVSAPLLYLGQHVAINLLLGLWFASTLRDGRQPLISMLAEKVHGPLAPVMSAYTRNVTRAWVAYFVAVALVSVAVYAAAPFATWAAFANLLTPLALAAMFGGERLLRYRLHPEFKRSSVLDAIRAYWNTSQPSPARGHDSLP